VGTSAKSGENVNEIFELMARKIIAKSQNKSTGVAATGGRKKKQRGQLKVDGLGEYFNPDA
jgi:hypothetical protein